MTWRTPRIGGRACVLIAVVSGVMTPTPAAALASTTVSATPVFPSVAVVGDRSLPAAVTLRSDNSAGASGSLTICNAGDGGACAGSDGITVLPSCAGSALECPMPDSGVFAVRGPATGGAGTECDGMTFTVTVTNGATGLVRFTPTSGNVVLSLPGTFCNIEFTVDVLRYPNSDPGSDDGAQTTQIGSAAGVSGVEGARTSFASATSTVVAAKALGQLTVGSSPASVPLGGSLIDQVALRNQFKPTRGEMTFSLFGPDACAGPMVFSATVRVTAGGGAISPPFAPTAAGRYHWIATYSGDVANYAVNGSCADLNESTVTLPAGSTPKCSDCDGDRFPSAVDCDDANAAVHPGAADRPGNTIDEDCSGSPADYPLLASVVGYRYRGVGRRTIFARLYVTRVRSGSTIRVRCSGGGCTFKSKTRKVKKDAAVYDLTALVRGAKLAPKSVLEIRVTKASTIGVLRRFTSRARLEPVSVERCLRPAAKRPGRCPL